MMEETTRSRNGYTLTAASASSASYDSSTAESVMAITDIYIVDTLPPAPFDPSLLAGDSSKLK
jgi:hypothetical protein